MTDTIRNILHSGDTPDAAAERSLAKFKHDPIYDTDPDGEEVVGVRISNVKHREQRAWLYRSDYEEIVKACGYSSWLIHGYEGRDGRIETKCRRKIISLVYSITREKGCKLRDNDPFNLRRSNFVTPQETREKRLQKREKAKHAVRTYWQREQDSARPSRTH